jgi:nucleoside-diphosphate-sugar epimerase
MKKKHFFLTGGTGFIGSNISKMLIERGHRVTIYDNNARGSLEKISSIISKVKFIKGDIRNQKKVLESMANKKIDAVIHLAYVNGTKFFYSKPELILEIAVKGLFNVIDGCMKNNIKEFYLASSSEVYQTPLKIPTDENEMLKIPDIMNPRYSYGGGKIISELLCINYGKKFFKKMIIFRPHNVYGKNMGNEHVIPEFINRFRNFKGKFFNIQGSGEETRSFIYISDFIKAFELILKKGKHLKNLALMISNFLNLKIKIRKTSLQPGSSLRRCPKISKIKKLGFKQKIKILDGLYKTIF